MPSVKHLKERLSQTLKAKKLDAALGALTLLAKEEPNEPSWPRRAAHLLKVRSDPNGAVAALRRALEIQVDQGCVLEAIATCKSILDVEPGDSRTLETLDLLYIERPTSKASAKVVVSRRASAPIEDAAMETLWLRDVVPGVRSISSDEASPGRIMEIPLDEIAEPEAESALDLRLDPRATDGRDSPPVSSVASPVVSRRNAMTRSALARNPRRLRAVPRCAPTSPIFHFLANTIRRVCIA